MFRALASSFKRPPRFLAWQIQSTHGHLLGTIRYFPHLRTSLTMKMSHTLGLLYPPLWRTRGNQRALTRGQPSTHMMSRFSSSTDLRAASSSALTSSWGRRRRQSTPTDSASKVQPWKLSSSFLGPGVLSRWLSLSPSFGTWASLGRS